MWQVMMKAGPLHSRLLLKGRQHMQELKQRYIANFGDAQRTSPFVVRPNARMLILRRNGARASL
jgi:hypothetical protein